MGYPFDRPNSAYQMADFIRNRSNMITKQITVRHRDENKAQVGDDPNNIVQI